MSSAVYPNGVLHQLQQVELELLKEFDKVCRANGLTYFLDGGSCLGQVRHGGFIPWDDDIDVGMPIEDYRRFMEIAPRSLAEGITLHTHQNTKGYSLFFAKLYKDKTLFLDENALAVDCPQGIFLDIFPFCALDENKRKGTRSRKKALFWQRLAFVKLNRRPHLIASMSHQKLIRFACLIAHYTLARLWSLDRMYELSKRAYGTKNPGTLWVNACSGDAVPREQEWIFPTKEAMFETLTVMVPHDCDAFLRAEYGDYMQIPPEDKRRTHAPLVLDFGDGINVMQ